MFLYQPPEPDRIIKKVRDGAKISRQEETIKHLQHGWFPANPDVLSTISKELSDGLYKVERETLINRIKADPALFIQCARNISHLENENTAKDPIDFLRTIEYEKLGLVLPHDNSQISMHRFKQSAQQQNVRLQHTLLSSATAESLAQTATASSSAAFTTAVFLDLGLNLIAWNYPRIYSQVMTRHKRYGDSIDQSLEKLLGISPSRIGARFASEWGLPPEVREALSSTRTSSTERTTLKDICRISSLLAESQDEQHFPQAAQALEKETHPLRKVLTPTFISDVRNKLEFIITPYLSKESPLSDFPLFKESAEAALIPESPALLENSYALRCSKQIQSVLIEVYHHIEPSIVSTDAIKLLTTHTARDLGFKNGCLYLLNAQHNRLDAALRFGEVQLSSYQHYKDQIKNIGGSLYSRAPFAQHAQGISGDDVYQVIGSLDHSRYEGVLYLESAIDDPEYPFILHYQALRRILNQALGEE